MVFSVLLVAGVNAAADDIKLLLDELAILEPSANDPANATPTARAIGLITFLSDIFLSPTGLLVSRN